ncbi:MAG: ATP-grasp domain-containing protein [Sedimentisphaerales bacterium]|nr:ATP-grasp domain-containing protein [Sedimentisphaerales bacterium]
MRILLSSVGRRGYLVKFFKDTIGSQGQVWGCDCSPYAPALYRCDKGVLLPEVSDPKYVDKVMEFCSANDIKMIVPLIDPELEVLSAHRERFFAAGIMAVISPPQTIAIGFDKYLTYQFGLENDIPVPQTVITLEEARNLIDSGSLSWPLVVKPRKGSASANITYCYDKLQLEAAFESCPLPMIQEFISGDEYGYDIFGDQDFQTISVFCKRKLTMRAGETDKAVSTDDPDLIQLGVNIANALELFGPMDVDVMVDEAGPKLLEINPRFGGGYPCSHFCGAEFPSKLIRLARGETLTPDIGSCPNGLYMFKQDEIIWLHQSQINSLHTRNDSDSIE